jgi:hypothetical protein
MAKSDFQWVKGEESHILLHDFLSDGKVGLNSPAILCHMEEQETKTAPIHEQKTRLVVVGKHDYIIENTERLLQKEGFETVGFTFLAEAMDYIRMNPIEAVLIGGGVDPHDRLQVTELVKSTLPQVKVIEHFGGPATIVPEVKKALAQ